MKRITNLPEQVIKGPGIQPDFVWFPSPRYQQPVY